MSDFPFDTEDLTVLRSGAAQLHELFLSLVESGFDEVQAIRLMGELLRSQP